MVLFHEVKGIRHSCIGVDYDRVVNHSVFCSLYPSDLLHLPFYRHVLVNYAYASRPCNRYRKFSLRNGIHGGRDYRSLQLYLF